MFSQAACPRQLAACLWALHAPGAYRGPRQQLDAFLRCRGRGVELNNKPLNVTATAHSEAAAATAGTHRVPGVDVHTESHEPGDRGGVALAGIQKRSPAILQRTKSRHVKRQRARCSTATHNPRAQIDAAVNECFRSGHAHCP
jgi:hypothetical protein